jgi:hypothetical protein
MEEGIPATFTAIVAVLAEREGVSVGAGRGFGANALQVEGRIFAMSDKAGLVLKLPRGRVAELIAAGDGLPFDAGKGRPMKEWVVIPPRSGDRWLQLAEASLAFVALAGPKR